MSTLTRANALPMAARTTEKDYACPMCLEPLRILSARPKRQGPSPADADERRLGPKALLYRGRGRTRAHARCGCGGRPPTGGSGHRAPRDGDPSYRSIGSSHHGEVATARPRTRSGREAQELVNWLPTQSCAVKADARRPAQVGRLSSMSVRSKCLAAERSPPERIGLRRPSPKSCWESCALRDKPSDGNGAVSNKRSGVTAPPETSSGVHKRRQQRLSLAASPLDRLRPGGEGADS